jgi:hypothetical protein
LNNLGVRVAALEARDELVEQLGKPDAAKRARPELLDESPVHQLQPLGDGEDLPHAPRDLGVGSVGDLLGEVLHRGGIRRDAEQAGAGFVMQLVGDLATLLLLHRDELLIEAAVLVARRIEGTGQHIEAIGDDGELLDLGRPEARGVMAVLEIEHAEGEIGERIEDPAEHHKEHARIKASSRSQTRASE